MADSATKVKIFDAEKAAHDFVDLRERRAKLRAKYEQEDEKLKAVQEMIKGHMLNHLTKTKSESVRTSFGTFYKQLEIKPSCQDWSVFYAWVREHDTFEFLEKRITRSQVVDYMEAHGEPPPGVNVHKEYDIRVRKNS